jgi:hypothetical protein
MNKNPDRPRWKRAGGPVTPTVVRFPDGNSSIAHPFVRISNPVAPIVVEFTPPTFLHLVLRRPEPEDESWVARVIHDVSDMEQSLGGRGVACDPDGSHEEPDKVLLRLFPKLIDPASPERIARLASDVARSERFQHMLLEALVV